MPTSGADQRGAEAMDEGDAQIAQSRQDLRSMTRAQAGTIFAKGHITNIMESIFDAPVATVEFQQAERSGLGRGESGKEIHDFGGRRLSVRDGARHLSHLLYERPGSGQIGIHLSTDLDGSHLSASAATIHGLVLLKARVRISEIRGQIRKERGLIAFDSQDRLSL